MTNTNAPATTTDYLRNAIRTNVDMLRAHRNNPALHAALLRSLAGSRRLLPIVKAVNNG